MSVRARSPRLAALIALLGVVTALQPAGPEPARAAGILVVTSPDKVQINNGLVTRTWRDTAGAGFRTTTFRDLRNGREWAPPGGSNELTIRLLGVTLTSADFAMDSAEREDLPGGGVRVTMRLSGPPLLSVDHVVEAYPGVAGFRFRTVLHPVAPLVLEGYSMAEFTPGPGLVPTGQTFHAGSDWRDEEGWSPQLQIGGEDTPRNGRSDWRVETTGPAGGPYLVEGTFASVRPPGSTPRLFVAGERPNLPSSVVSYRGGRVASDADLGRDVLSMGPIESEIHVQNPLPVVGVRRRALLPGRPLELEPGFVGVATSRDDEPWQLSRYLRAAGWDYPLAVTFNTNTIDDSRLGVPGGAKDDVDQEEFFEQLAVAEPLGVETFILDDGWQLNSGDWLPDPARYPDGFGPVRDALHDRGMDLGLWMSPLSFHPDSDAFRQNPTWSCFPVGTGTGLANATPLGEAFLGGSAEAGIGVWSPEALSLNGSMIEDLEAKIERAITEFGSVYFKFDFLVWLDCLNPEPSDLYGYRESFVDMIDRLHERHPGVTFQIDETNDYRMWPYESVVRGPSWFQNGGPQPNWLLHNLWTVAPYVPVHSIGQAALGEGNVDRYGVDYIMAMSMLSHLTFWRDLTTLTPEEITRAREWVDRYRDIRGDLAEMVTFPLLTDPSSGKSWAALQPFDLDRQRGYLFAFRQDTGRVTQVIPMRGVRAGLTYRVTDLVTGEDLGTFTGAELAAGLAVSAPARHTARILTIDPA